MPAPVTIPAISNTWTMLNVPNDAYTEGGSATQPVGFGSGRLLLPHVMANWWNVKGFGAVGDGVTNDRAAIQAAITFIESLPDGGTLFLPPGTYLIGTSALQVSALKNIHIVGRGWGQNNIGGVGGSVLKAGGAWNVLEVGSAGADRTCDVRLENFRIDGATTAPVGLLLNRVHNMYVFGVRVERTVTAAIDLNRAYANLIERCICHINAGDGIRLNENNDLTRILNCALLACLGSGVHLTNGDASGTQIRGGDIEGCGIGIQLECGSAAQCQSVVIDGVYFESQIGKNISVGENVSSFFYDSLSIINVNVNPGIVSAAVNSIALDRCRSTQIIGGSFVLCNVTKTANTGLYFLQPGYRNGATFPTGGDGMNFTNLNGWTIRSDAAGTFHIGTTADWPFKLMANNAARWEVGDSGLGYAFGAETPNALFNIKGISKSTTLANNLCGSVTLVAGAGAVVFPTAEPDANYILSLTGINSGAEVFSVNGGFTGTGFIVSSSNVASTATVHWHLLR